MAINDNNQVQVANVKSDINKDANNIQKDENTFSIKLKAAHNILDNAKKFPAKGTNNYDKKKVKAIVAQQGKKKS